jgi:hypothetical protein
MSALVSKADIERMVYLIDGDDFASRLERCIELQQLCKANRGEGD